MAVPDWDSSCCVHLDHVEKDLWKTIVTKVGIFGKNIIWINVFAV